MVYVVDMRMSTRCLCLCLTGILFSLAILTYNASAHTDLLHVQALQDLYRTLNSSSQLKSWKSDGGDPCEESWTGVYCNSSSVIHIILPGLALTGYLGPQLVNLKQLHIRTNSIHGEILASLPLNITHLSLAGNNFSKSIPYSLTSMKNLLHLNLSHNMLSGPIGNVFTGLTYLEEMGLSDNNFTGNLATSFGNLTILTRLYLQNNQISVSAVSLAALPLSDLNLAGNNFSKSIPYSLTSMKNLPHLYLQNNQISVSAVSLATLLRPSNLSLASNYGIPTQFDSIENLRIGDYKREIIGVLVIMTMGILIKFLEAIVYYLFYFDLGDQVDDAFDVFEIDEEEEDNLGDGEVVNDLWLDDNDIGPIG